MLYFLVTIQTQSRAGSTVGRLCSQLQSRSPLYVVHSPFGWFYHRCHCNCRDPVLFVLAMSCGGLDGAYYSIWDSVRPMTGKYITYSFQYQGFVACICMLNFWFSSNVEICADNYIYFRFTLQACVAVSSGRCICTVFPVQLDGQCRSEKWEVFSVR